MNCYDGSRDSCRLGRFSEFDLPKMDGDELELSLPPDRRRRARAVPPDEVELLAEEAETAKPAEEAPPALKRSLGAPPALPTTSRLFVGPLYDTIDALIQHLNGWGSKNGWALSRYGQRTMVRDSLLG